MSRCALGANAKNKRKTGFLCSVVVRSRQLDAGDVRPRPLVAAHDPWDQFGLETAIWTMPAEATTTAKSHCVPLSHQAWDCWRSSQGD